MGKETDSFLEPASVREERLTSKSLYFQLPPCPTIISMLPASPSISGPAYTDVIIIVFQETIRDTIEKAMRRWFLGVRGREGGKERWGKVQTTSE